MDSGDDVWKTYAPAREHKQSTKHTQSTKNSKRTENMRKKILLFDAIGMHIAVKKKCIILFTFLQNDTKCDQSLLRTSTEHFFLRVCRVWWMELEYVWLFSMVEIARTKTILISLQLNRNQCNSGDMQISTGKKLFEELSIWFFSGIFNIVRITCGTKTVNQLTLTSSVHRNNLEIEMNRQVSTPRIPESTTTTYKHTLVGPQRSIFYTCFFCDWITLYSKSKNHFIRCLLCRQNTLILSCRRR